MTSPDHRADNTARSAATDLVESALTSGRIIQADRDMRIDQIRRAQTMQDVDLIVRDLRTSVPGARVPPVPATVSTTFPAASSPPSGAEPWPLVNYGPTSGHVDVATATASQASGAGRAIGGLIAIIVLLAVVVPIAGAVIAFTASRDSFPDFDDVGPTDDTTYLPGQAPGEDGVNVLTVDGFQAMSDALQDETGQRFAYSAVLYPRYAVIEVPTGTNTRYQNWYWDGRALELQDYKSSSTNDQFDLTLIDPRMVIDLVDQARAKIDDPDGWYVVISDFELAEAQVTAYASNDFDETAYLTATLDGTIVYDSTTQQ